MSFIYLTLGTFGDMIVPSVETAGDVQTDGNWWTAGKVHGRNTV
jgi:hypothetical protein